MTEGAGARLAEGAPTPGMLSGENLMKSSLETCPLLVLRAESVSTGPGQGGAGGLGSFPPQVEAGPLGRQCPPSSRDSLQQRSTCSEDNTRWAGAAGPSGSGWV